MAHKVTLGGDRLGSGNKLKIELHGYERSTHDMGYLWRSTMSAGTLVPFLTEIGLPGDTFDIQLHADIKTHPTVGPLFGSYKVQLDIFQCPMRLYNGKLHNNKLGIGLNMAAVKLPVMTLYTTGGTALADIEDWDNKDINPSCILSYLGIRGIGNAIPDAGVQTREFCGLGLLSYWDIFKNYYANKMEENAYVIHTTLTAIINTVDTVSINSTAITDLNGQPPSTIPLTTINAPNLPIGIAYTGTLPLLEQIMIQTNIGYIALSTVAVNITSGGGNINAEWDIAVTGNVIIYGWVYINENIMPVKPPELFAFPLEEIDEMREQILSVTTAAPAFNVGAAGGSPKSPYKELLTPASGLTPYRYSQEGLAVKTYQSDLFNNWLNEEFIDGTNGINEITAIDTSGGSFNIETLQLSKKVYDMLNRVAVSGGSYDDWLDAVYDHERYTRAETPIYHGGLIKELVFQEVISNAEGSTEGTSQPLGTLGGRGVMGQKHKGGDISIRVDEPSYIMGIISLTPRIDYSQGNKWDVHLKTMDDLHKPALDEIGFQDLITEQMAWWDTTWDDINSVWRQHSAGKQPAWLNYMTNVNQVRGNFAILNNEMFMVLNRRYEAEATSGRLDDLTTYIDPVKFNYSFAETAIDAQNFWAQISVDITARRKISAKLMPNL